MELSDILNDTWAFIKFTVIFESTRKKCTEDQQTRYYQIIDQLLKEELSNEENVFIRDGSFLPC
ncbi:hypothetical protein J41TS12_11650 [Paenibacillus antibioticophila]|uniref:Uncharacterized protein n=1 Tax=Paenibacillus antibioticophila TaxID=1274374 RepID=A0A919XP09_9BACL|nr:hypothetical protein J41TS12_11650 [Paenibacillus antibioticophila]